MIRSAASPDRTPAGAWPAAHAPAELVTGYDYAAVFELSGRPGEVHQDVITVSPDAMFVAMAISYGLDERRGRPLPLTVPQPPPPVTPGTFVPAAHIELGLLPPDALITGFRVAPAMEPVVFTVPAPGTVGPVPPLTFSSNALPLSFAPRLLERVVRPEDFSFFLNIVDTASGRELQDEPMHSLASLGRSDGKRPFRPLARPMTFLPRTTVRLQVSEQSLVLPGSTLFIVLHGYRIYTTSGCSEAFVRSLSPSQPTVTGESAVPFDYVASLELTGRAGNLVSEEIAVHTDNRFVATAIGYGLEPEPTDVQIGLPGSNPVNLDTLALRAFPPDALRDGIRLRSGFARFAFSTGGALASVPRDLADRMFERLNRPEQVSFLYSIFDGGTGRDLQNRPIHNVAGLGDASGDRPFKALVRPMQFLPRSTIRVTVEERFGRGRLYFVLQGYKVTGAPARGLR
ncbi:MAG TPA: hypothetical protein VD833_14790 [Vicinamibacterales bacterium]|nr:hypothetical protein [Vicinamibacterales bacterium]